MAVVEEALDGPLERGRLDLRRVLFPPRERPERFISFLNKRLALVLPQEHRIQHFMPFLHHVRLTRVGERRSVWFVTLLHLEAPCTRPTERWFHFLELTDLHYLQTMRPVLISRKYSVCTRGTTEWTFNRKASHSYTRSRFAQLIAIMKISPILSGNLVQASFTGNLYCASHTNGVILVRVH